MIKDIDDLMTINNAAQFIKEHGADQFLKYLWYVAPSTGHALTSAVLEDHARDYDKKKAALLKKNVS